MTKRSRTQRFPVDPPISIDWVLRAGGRFVVSHEDGSRTAHEPLIVPEGGVVTIRVRYRCRACTRPPAAEVEHYTAEDGREVVCFVGKAYRAGADGEQVGYSCAALIEPDYGTPAVCECPEHGVLDLDRQQVRRDVARSLAVQLRQGRNPKEKGTRTVRLRPKNGVSAA